MKFAILWEQWTGYIDICVRALCDYYPVEILRAHLRPTPPAPFRPEDFVESEYVHVFDDQPVESELVPLIARFKPDALLIASWHRPVYRRIARSFAGQAVRIVGIDNQWRGTLKQWAGRLTAPYFIRPMYDKALVAGPRQRRFARMLGFPDSAIFAPLYCCNFEQFANATAPPGTDVANFLFVGRLVEEKGIRLLVSAYRAYRAGVTSKPWGLIIVGTGPLHHLIEGVEGIEYYGFTQPADLPALYARASCFVLPSLFEPWGVVLHEAVCAGLPVICSTACGAGDVFVSQGTNGVVVRSGDLRALTEGLIKIAELPSGELARFRQHSRVLSRSITPDLWADVIWRTIQP
jgi:glycosyltransferase involved in cell wall biosynthesis